MQKIILKPSLHTLCSVSLTTIAGRWPYDGFIENEYIGTLIYNPITKGLFPESMVLLKKLGYEDYTIEVVSTSNTEDNGCIRSRKDMVKAAKKRLESDDIL